jgi:CHAT domain-containing protein
MLLFYKKLWQEGRSPLAAMRAAQLELFRHPLKIEELTQGRGLQFIDAPMSSTSQPRLWAAFVVSGVRRPDVVQLVAEMNREMGR